MSGRAPVQMSDIEIRGNAITDAVSLFLSFLFQLIIDFCMACNLLESIVLCGLIHVLI